MQQPTKFSPNCQSHSLLCVSSSSPSTYSSSSPFSSSSSSSSSSSCLIHLPSTLNHKLVICGATNPVRGQVLSVTGTETKTTTTTTTEPSTTKDYVNRNTSSSLPIVEATIHTVEFNDRFERQQQQHHEQEATRSLTTNHQSSSLVDNNIKAKRVEPNDCVTSIVGSNLSSSPISPPSTITSDQDTNRIGSLQGLSYNLNGSIETSDTATNKMIFTANSGTICIEEQSPSTGTTIIQKPTDSSRSDIIIAINRMMQRRVELKTIDRQLAEIIAQYLRQLDEPSDLKLIELSNQSIEGLEMDHQDQLNLSSQIEAIDLSSKAALNVQSVSLSAVSPTSATTTRTSSYEFLPSLALVQAELQAPQLKQKAHSVNLRKSRLLGRTDLPILDAQSQQRCNDNLVQHFNGQPFGKLDDVHYRSPQWTANMLMLNTSDYQQQQQQQQQQYQQCHQQSSSFLKLNGSSSSNNDNQIVQSALFNLQSDPQFHKDNSRQLEWYKRQLAESGQVVDSITKRFRSSDQLSQSAGCDLSASDNLTIIKQHHYHYAPNAYTEQVHLLHQQPQTYCDHPSLLSSNLNNPPPVSNDNHQRLISSICHKPMAYRCHVCGSGFEDRHRLQQHLSIHLNLHPSWFEEKTIKETKAQYESRRGDYLCTSCSLRYETTAEFDKHMQLHGEKPHQCELCSQDNKLVSFRYYRQLLTHLRTHCFLYSCKFSPDCKQTANRKDYLKLHILKHHLNNKLPEQYSTCYDQ